MTVELVATNVDDQIAILNFIIERLNEIERLVAERNLMKISCMIGTAISEANYQKILLAPAAQQALLPEPWAVLIE